MLNAFPWPLVGASLLGAVAFGIHLGETTVGLIDPIHFQGPAVHPRDRGAIYQPRPQPVVTYADLYGWDEGQTALTAECVGCASVEDDFSYSAAVPYFGAEADGDVEVIHVRATLEEKTRNHGMAEAEKEILPYAYYPIEGDRYEPDREGGEDLVALADE